MSPPPLPKKKHWTPTKTYGWRELSQLEEIARRLWNSRIGGRLDNPTNCGIGFLKVPSKHLRSSITGNFRIEVGVPYFLRSVAYHKIMISPIIIPTMCLTMQSKEK